MREQDMIRLLAAELKVKDWQIEKTIELFDAGNTIPFVARYRKEVTGELNEEQLRLLTERLQYLRNLVKRKEEISKAIEEQGKMTEELAALIAKAVKLQELEDIYLPYKPKKRTRAQIAKEKGLEPLAELVLRQEEKNSSLEVLAKGYLNEELLTVEDVIRGVLDIIAEAFNERTEVRNLLRKKIWQQGKIRTELEVAEEAGQDFLMYRDREELLARLEPHRVLAINRGEKQEILKVYLLAPHEEIIKEIVKLVILADSSFKEHLAKAAADSYKRLLFPAIEREIRAQLTENAQKQAIKVFALNLRQRLLEAPLPGFRVLGLDPGYRTGCKAAVVNEQGRVLVTKTMYLTGSEKQKREAEDIFLSLVNEHKISLVAIGNGTASYETEVFTAEIIEKHQLDLHYLIVSEAGASVYSASKLARDELPELDVSLRGAVSIARRVQDPLAELVKIDPKSIGVGQYQHDVNQKQLKETLAGVVESVVNHVGVELNTASPALLAYVAGISSGVAKNIVAYRDEHGCFKDRKELLQVSRLGKSAFIQCAGFLRIKDSSDPLDNTSIHPESYELTRRLITRLGYSLDDLRYKVRLELLQQEIKQADASVLAEELAAGEPTVRDIMQCLLRPGRDPREELPKPLTRKNIVKLSEIMPGSLVRGRIQNVTDFGAFVDFGIKVNGLIHRSELSWQYFRHPLDVVMVGEIVECLVLSVDEKRNRIALSLKQAIKEGKR